MSVEVVIQDGPIEAGDQASSGVGMGASLRFLGIVRPLEDGRAIDGLDYDVYEPMARQVLGDLCRQALDRFGVLSIRLTHSRGFVPVGGASLAVTIDSRHRAESLDAMRWLIDELKRDAPIWKRPVPSDVA